MEIEVVKPAKLRTAAAAAQVRTRRAYFDCRYGQLHVRTAFPTTGGFDELVTLFCLHAQGSSSRGFARFLPEIAGARSVYAPDLPGSGESDPTPDGSVAAAALAMADLARDLRLRQIDVLGIFAGARIAMELAAAQPELVRRLVLVGIPASERLPVVTQPSLVLRTRFENANAIARAHAAVGNGRVVEVPDYAEDMFEAAPKTLAAQIEEFLGK